MKIATEEDAAGVSERSMSRSDWESILAEQCRRHGRVLFGLAYGVLRETEREEDACQQAFLRAWQERDRIHDAKSLPGWLSRTVVNESLAVLRRRQTERRVLRERGRSVRDGDGLAQWTERHDLAVAAMEQLAEPTRTIVALRIMEGVSGNEVGEMLGCSASEVSRRLHRGLERMRRYLIRQSIGSGA